jgi:hypothetical protein
VRVQTFGSPWIRWIRVTVDAAAAMPFRIEAVEPVGTPAQ